MTAVRVKHARTHRSFISGPAALLLALLLAVSSALAAGSIDLSRTVSLTVCVQAGETPAAGVQIDLYRVADISEEAVFTAAGGFAKYPVPLEAENADQWRDLALTISGYAANETPCLTGTTDEAGVFTAQNLKPGLYLALTAPFDLEGTRCTFEETLVSLPSLSEEDEWQYDVTVQPKKGPEQALKSLQVQKVWDDGGSDKRPASITVDLMQYNEVVETVTLNRDNNWRHSWTNLTGAGWRVLENPVPEGYKVVNSMDGTLITITNSKGGGGNPPDSSELPQTGLDWKPVWLTAAAGMLLFGWGWLRYRKSREQESK